MVRIGRGAASPVTETLEAQGALVALDSPFAPIFETFEVGEDVTVHIIGGMEVNGVFLGFDGTILTIRSGRTSYHISAASVAVVEEPI